jgi:hypothetical protein
VEYTSACRHLDATEGSLCKTLIWAWRGIKVCHSSKEVLRLFSSRKTSYISSTLCTNSGACFQKKRMKTNFLVFLFIQSHLDLFLDGSMKTKFS